MAGSQVENRGREEKALPWILTLFGTAVGAGILYLPLQAGSSGIWAFVLLSLFIFPIIYYSHSYVVTLLLLEISPQNYAGVVGHFMGRIFGLLIILAFLITFYTILLSYAMGLNASIGPHIPQFSLMNINWAQNNILIIIILLVFALVQMINKKIMLTFMSFFSLVLIIILFGISISLVPLWDYSIFYQLPELHDLAAEALRILPILVLSLVFFPAISSMVIAFRSHPGVRPLKTRMRLQSAIFITSMLLWFFILFFVFSCSLSLTPEELAHAIKENLNSLTILSYKEGLSPQIANLGELFVILALFTSFIGIFFAVKEAAQELVREVIALLTWKKRGPIKYERGVDIIIHLLIYFSLWAIATQNPSFMNIFSDFISPLVVFFLFILPILILIKARGFHILMQPTSLFIVFSGILLHFSYEIGAYLQNLLESHKL
ncbi:serine transporter [Desulfobotulus alkaliphilus]|uniref:Serine transporter n=1 Tax=Desulfobotulus alkaliphilus TaxID=622671 RepID=A0A562R895_9BACT|nr:aromatic amino acid transport family protein [Desulfobotulus alkaliphilus]TWI64784.1 serine transporter [Desulfobotulus alkaliphilus]